MAIARFIGVDLAWLQRSDGRQDNETGVVALDGAGSIVDAGWRRGVGQTVDWMKSVAELAGTLAFIDASLVVDNPTGQRLCEKQVGQRYGHLKVSANTTNQGSPRRAGIELLKALESEGWKYSSGLSGPPTSGMSLSECYPYTTLVGTEEFGYYRTERPKYKRQPRGIKVADWRPQRAAACDELIRRLAGLATAEPPLDLGSHPETAKLLSDPSPEDDREYKHREDLIDAAIAAWSASLWSHHPERCQVLGPLQENDAPAATIIAPALPEQRGPLPVTPPASQE